MYAIGFQEIVDLNAMNVALDNSRTIQRQQFWQEKIAECLASTGINFQLISSRAMVGLLLCIYVQEKSVTSVRDVRGTSLGVGIMGMMGNKGGVCIRLSLYDSSLCFVCSHLAAHRENVTGRNNDFKNIYEKSLFTADGVFDDSDLNADLVMTKPKLGSSCHIGKDLSVSSHEFVFWLGDLNYRIDDDLSIDEIFDKISKGDFVFLREKDQLNLERKKGNVFQSFNEGELNFPPTYKYQPGTDDYEARPEKKKRAPAWCDRVLWRTSSDVSSEAVRLLSYRRSNLQPSDHKPVSALFDCDFRSIIFEKEDEAYHGLVNTYEFWRNDQTPSISVSQTTINVGKVRYEVHFNRKECEYSIIDESCRFQSRSR